MAIRFEQFAVVAECPVGRNVERPVAPACVDTEHPARRHAMSNTELVKDVRVEDRNVRKHHVAGHELEKHVTSYVAGSLLLICSKGLTAGLFEGWG